VKTRVASLRESAASGSAHTALLETEAMISEFETVDRRARDYIKSGDHLMAADVIFSEGGDTATRAAWQVEAARLGEHRALDAFEADRRREQVIALGAGAGAIALIILLLAPVPRMPEAVIAEEPQRIIAPTPVIPQPQAPPVRMSPILTTAADLCTEFGRVRNLLT
jgi:hypothetical protein